MYVPKHRARGQRGCNSYRKLTRSPVYCLRGSTPRSTAEVLLLGGSPWSRVRGLCFETKLSFGRLSNLVNSPLNVTVPKPVLSRCWIDVQWERKYEEFANIVQRWTRIQEGPTKGQIFWPIFIRMKVNGILYWQKIKKTILTKTYSNKVNHTKMQQRQNRRDDHLRKQIIEKENKCTR